MFFLNYYKKINKFTLSNVNICQFYKEKKLNFLLQDCTVQTKNSKLQIRLIDIDIDLWNQPN